MLRAREHIPLDRPVVVNYCDFAAYQDSELLAERLSQRRGRRHHPRLHRLASAHGALHLLRVRAHGRRTCGRTSRRSSPGPTTRSSEFASSGTYAFASGKLLLDSLEQQVEEGHLLKGEYYLSLTYKPLLARGGRVEVLELQHFMQWGTPQDFEEYRETSRAVAAWTAPRVGHGEDRTSVARVPACSWPLAPASVSRTPGTTHPKPALPLSGRPVVDHALAGLPGQRRRCW